MGPVSRPHVLLSLGLAGGRGSEQLEALDNEVELLDAVTLNVADPRGDAPLDVNLATLAAVLADDLGGLLPRHHVVELGEAVDVGGDAQVTTALPLWVNRCSGSAVIRPRMRKWLIPYDRDFAGCR